MTIELEELEIAHISSLITERKNTIEKILNAVEEDKDDFLKNHYKKEKRILDGIYKKIWKGVKDD